MKVSGALVRVNEDKRGFNDIRGIILNCHSQLWWISGLFIGDIGVYLGCNGVLGDIYEFIFTGLWALLLYMGGA